MTQEVTSSDGIKVDATCGSAKVGQCSESS